jgi:predicted nucleotidyltransferase
MAAAGNNPGIEKMIDRMVRRIVRRFRPEQVILFGSRARGTASADSDVDLLVVMPVSGSILDKIVEIRCALGGIRVAKDILVVTPESFRKRRGIVGTVAHEASHGGKVLYARGA